MVDVFVPSLGLVHLANAHIKILKRMALDRVIVIVDALLVTS